ncbi:Ppx/GppA phosphatase family-domain-containing protein [Lipomyces japonicus]|uniref:Ppx/GppA phosphatase family-domain-containing protein n=1 Tax=Lipomyces japonicus TaxID=56871 RepID=UPI0034CF9A16
MSIPSDVYGVVEIGSNGVRFVVADLPQDYRARNLAPLFYDRAKISVFDAISSNSSNTIPPGVLFDLRHAIERFNKICGSLNVLSRNISVIATEACRRTSNAGELAQMLHLINPEWSINFLSQEVESNYGVWGIISSLSDVQGITVDVGGGSCQISWTYASKDIVHLAPKPALTSFGAIELSNRLHTVGENQLKRELISSFQRAFREIQVPAHWNGVTLYLCGGGLRALAALSMYTQSQHKPYPIPVINGYRCTMEDLKRLVEISINESIIEDLEKVFRISKRRAMQIPALLVLVRALIVTAPSIISIYFCQGGVKEGLLFEKIPPEVRLMDPLVTSTKRLAKPASAHILELVQLVTPPSLVPLYIFERMLPAVAYSAYEHMNYSKDTRATAALIFATFGNLSTAYGLSHIDRALLGLILCERWGGDVMDDEIKDGLRNVVIKECGGSSVYLFWGQYIAILLQILAGLFPVGIVDDNNRVKAGISGSSTDLLINLSFARGDPFVESINFRIEKLGKKLMKLRKKHNISDFPRIDVRIGVH